MRLFEMKPLKYTEAHKSPKLGELVCSNSLKSLKPGSAAGLLKTEMEGLGSLIMQAAHRSKVPAGHALAVDRDKFATLITDAVLSDPNISMITGEVVDISLDELTIVSTGPLTSGALAEFLMGQHDDTQMYFYDAIAPIINFDSIDKEWAFWADRYSDEPGDYLNCVLNEDNYEKFYNALCSADTLLPRPFEKQKYFESCMPIEALAARGRKTPLFGPMKPVGLRDPKTGDRPFAVVQLRKEDKDGNYLNMVGFQTRLGHADQKKVFSLIPALKNATYARFGSVHRNTFLNAPRTLDPDLSLKGQPNIIMAGQITGVEGYIESASCGLLAGLFAAAKATGTNLAPPDPSTGMGAMLNHLRIDRGSKFQPSNLNFGLFPPLPKKLPKKERGSMYVERANHSWKQWIGEIRDHFPCL